MEVVTMSRNYSTMMKYDTFEDRVRYLMLHQKPGDETLGHLRYLTQQFYKTREWKQIRRVIMARDLGLEVGVVGYPIYGHVYVHHIIPITEEMIYNNDPLLTDPNNLVCCSLQVHNLIHFGHEEDLLVNTERMPGDNQLW